MLDNAVDRLVQRRLGNLGGRRYRPVDASSLHAFLNAFRDMWAAVPLVRIGGDFDGGYLIPDDLVALDACFSPGVGPVCAFDEALMTKHGVSCFMADASVAGLPIAHDLADFEPGFIGPHEREGVWTLSGWIDRKVPPATRDLALQMDIEGAEWAVLAETPDSTLARFRWMAIEFHHLGNWLTHPGTLAMVQGVFARLAHQFVIVHAHPNNCAGVEVLHGVEIPRVLEVSFLRRDRLSELAGSAPQADMPPLIFPHPLDQPNAAGQPDTVLPECWWPCSVQAAPLRAKNFD